jgi:hypothetical protein
MQLWLKNHWIILALAGLFLLWLMSLLVVRYWSRRQLLKDLERQGEGSEELALPFPEPRPEDLQALELVRNYRRGYLLRRWPGTEFSFQVINDMAVELIQGIAAIYFPDEDRPEFKASLADLVALHNRVGAQLASWLESFPMRPFKDLELKTVLRYHEVYQTVTQHPVYSFIQRHHLGPLARWGWTLYNYANPLVWGSRAAYHGGKEVAARLLLARIVDLVGEEAIHLYGRRG